jgi:pectate lyase
MSQPIVNLMMVLGLWLVMVLACCNSRESTSRPGNTGSTSNPASSSTQEGGATRISAVDLFNEFKTNRETAAARYKDKTLIVTGKIRTIVSSGRSVVVNSGERSDILGVQCLIEEAERDRVSSLSQGQDITVIGVYFGKIGHVILKDCAIQ